MSKAIDKAKLLIRLEQNANLLSATEDTMLLLNHLTNEINQGIFDLDDEWISVEDRLPTFADQINEYN